MPPSTTELAIEHSYGEGGLRLPFPNPQYPVKVEGSGWLLGSLEGRGGSPDIRVNWGKTWRTAEVQLSVRTDGGVKSCHMEDKTARCRDKLPH